MTDTGIITTQDVHEALRITTQALKDIINAADNGEPYTREELAGSFSDDYNQGYKILQSLGIEEIA